MKNSTDVFIPCLSFFIFVKVVRTYAHDNIEDLREVV